MMYMCSDKFTLEGQQLYSLEKMASRREDQDVFEEDEATKDTEDDIAPISDAEEDDLIDDTEAGLAVEGTDGGDKKGPEEVAHNDEPQDATMTDRAEDEDDDEDLLPPPVTRLGERSHKRSSGRVTVPSRRLQGYELY